jgi:hypothetical protein
MSRNRIDRGKIAMLLQMYRDRKNRNFRADSGGARSVLRSGMVPCIVLFAMLPAGYMLRSQAPMVHDPIPGANGNRTPGANDVMKVNEQNQKKGNVEAGNTERKRQISEDSARLLKLATDLKAEVDKTNKDMLSVAVIRKADQIEKLAHAVKEKMKLTMNGN